TGDLDNNPRTTYDNQDGNREVFVAKLRHSGPVITQITNTVAPAQNFSGSIDVTGKLVIFSSTADLVPGENPDNNSEVFSAFRGTIKQLTKSSSGENVNPVANSTGRFVVFESTADLKADGATNRRVFFMDRLLDQLPCGANPGACLQL